MLTFIMECHGYGSHLCSVSGFVKYSHSVLFRKDFHSRAAGSKVESVSCFPWVIVGRENLPVQSVLWWFLNGSLMASGIK